MVEYAENHECRHLWELALLYESSRGGISQTHVFEMMQEVVVKIKKSVEAGLEGTHYHDRILDDQTVKFNAAKRAGKLLPSSLVNTIIAYTIAMMEVKSSMGIIVAAPTAGSCAVLPGAILGTAKELNLSVDMAVKAMLSAGMIGVFIAQHATFAAEVGGCQAECGAGSGMAAAALAELAGGGFREAITASSFALQNIMGMVCDPVANRVEVPCMGKNVMAAMNALSSATMALGGVDAVIPLDEVIKTMDKVGRMLPSELRCTGYGGLSVTPTAKEIERRMAQSG
jgi:L-serine dehydratase